MEKSLKVTVKDDGSIQMESQNINTLDVLGIAEYLKARALFPQVGKKDLVDKMFEHVKQEIEKKESKGDSNE